MFDLPRGQIYIQCVWENALITRTLTQTFPLLLRTIVQIQSNSLQLLVSPNSFLVT